MILPYKIITILCLFCLAYQNSYAQIVPITISGVLKDDKGEALPGATILIIGSEKGTTTDIDGKYTLVAKVGDKVRVSYIGYKDRYYTVTANGLKADNKAEENRRKRNDLEAQTQPKSLDYFQYLQDTTKNDASKNGIGVFRKNSPPHKADELFTGNPDAQIYRVRVRPDGSLKIRAKNYDFDHTKRIQIALENQVYLSNPNRLPALQKEYAQGRPLNGKNTWQGAETNEVFSWGAPISTLKYVNGNYSYDRNGALAESGAGRQAESYNPYQFLRTGVASLHAVEVLMRNRKYNYYYDGNRANKAFLEAKVRYERIQNTGILSQTGQQIDKVNLKFTRTKKNTTFEGYAGYIAENAQIPEKGNNWQQIFSSVLRTPPTFDNSNGLSRKEATQNTSAYLLPDNSLRSHSPNQSFNPFQLAQTLADHNDRKKLYGKAQMSYKNPKYDAVLENIDFSVYYNKYFNKTILTTSSLPAVLDRRTEREENIDNFQTELKVQFGEYSRNVKAKYLLDYRKDNLYRIDALPTGEKITQGTPQRWKHQVELSGEYGRSDFLEVELKNNSYFSSTSPKPYLLLPHAWVKANTLRVIDSWFNWGVFSYNAPNIYWEARFDRSVDEMSLVYGSWDYNALAYTSAQYARYFENQELFIPQGILPEVNTVFHTTLYTEDLWKVLRFRVDYENGVIQNFITPILQNDGSFIPKNVGTVRNRSVEFAVYMQNKEYGYGRYYNSYPPQKKMGFSTSLHAEIFRPFVKDLNPDLKRTEVPLAGYQDISTNLIAGKPFGSIVGSAYLRNEAGELLIDQAGFPTVNPQAQIIGNPNPNLLLSWKGSMYYKNLTLSFTFDARIGGQVWNGTQAALNYWGRSQESADLRGTTGYVFQGVQANGQPNQIPVSFANPNLPVGENRWVRYGLTGVGEEGIEKATSLRLSSFELKYDLGSLLSKMYFASQTSISFFGQNILLYAPYKGNDPLTNLMGYRQGAGLDLFNLPAPRSWGFNLKTKF